MDALFSGMTKRQFMKLVAACGGAMVVPGGRVFAKDAAMKDGIPYRMLGRTGVPVSLVGVGGFHIGAPKEEVGIEIIRSALDRGINFLDNCWDYHDGLSEERMGRALRDGYREKAFLMSKIDGRNRKAAAAQIDQSLKRLQTDHIDLMQLHEVIRTHEPEEAFASGGSIEALVAAQKAGKIRFIGFTGHKNPGIHLSMLLTAAKQGFRFDAVQMPLNVMDAHFESFEKKVLPYLVKEDIGVLAMKPMGGGFILKEDAVTAVECLHYAMTLPTSVVITGCESMKVLDQAISAAKDFRPLDAGQMAQLLSKTATLAQGGKLEKYKTSEHFDGTTKKPEWLTAVPS